MAIEVVGVTTKTVTGEPMTLTSIEVPIPSGLQLDDVVHTAVYLARTKFATWEDDGTHLYPWQEDKSSTPRGGLRGNVPGWVLVDRYRHIHVEFPDDTLLLRRIITGAEGPTVTVEIHWGLSIFDPPVDGQEIIVTAAAVAHRGADLNRIYASPPRLSPWPTGWNTGALETSRLTQFRFYRRHDFSGGLDVGNLIPATPDPVVNTGGVQPPEWDVLAEARLPAIETIDHYRRSGAIAATQILATSAVVLDAAPGTFTPGAASGGPWEAMPGTSNTNRFIMFALIDPDVIGLPTDPPPPPDQPGVTGSGWIIPEWVGRTQQILDPLHLSVWEENAGELVQTMIGEETPIIGLNAWFNGVGACTTAAVSFPADPGFVPWRHALKIGLTQPGDEEPTVWWTGVVRNVRATGGIYVVDLDGLWGILNDARVQLDEEDQIDRPDYPLLTGTLLLGGGDPTAIEIKNAADRQQSWGQFLGTTFRINPDAAWGVGPDRVFVMGLPSNAGLTALDVGNPVVAEITPGEFILPPFVTEWWAEENDGTIHGGGLVPPPGMLTPRRLVQSRLGDLDNNLLTPAEAWLPTHAGPSHTLTVAGMAVPPIRADNLPAGSQMVASARVTVTIGEDGSMPSIKTTLTTVALPYRRGRGL